MRAVRSLAALAVVVVLASVALAQSPTRQELYGKLVEKRHELDVLELRYLAPSTEDVERARSLGLGPRSGAVRLVPRRAVSGYSPLTVRGFGAYFNFVLQDHDYDLGADICLEDGRLTTGLAGADYGYFANLGRLPLTSLTKQHPAVEWLRSLRVPTKLWDARAEQRRATDGVIANGVEYRNHVSVEIGDTYLLRSVRYGAGDVIVAFVPEREDSDQSLILIYYVIDTPPGHSLQPSVE
jgi:hypothetical protein